MGEEGLIQQQFVLSIKDARCSHLRVHLRRRCRPCPRYAGARHVHHCPARPIVVVDMSSKGKDDDNAHRNGEICRPDKDDDRRVLAIDDIINACIAASGWEGL